MTRQGLEPCCTPVHTGRCQTSLWRGAMSKQSVWLRWCPNVDRCLIYQLITAETHAVGRHHPVDPVASCLFGCQGSGRQ